MYPSELVLKKTTESCDMLSYLDIRITILESRYVLAVYDKRDNFHFGIVNFMCSNIPAGPAYGIYWTNL